MSVLAAAIASGSSSSTLNDVEPGLLGFLIVAGMGLILFFLLKNMNKQFKKLPPKESDLESAVDEASDAGGDEQAVPAGQVVAGQVIAAETAQTDRVQTGDPKLDEQAQGITKRK